MERLCGRPKKLVLAAIVGDLRIRFIGGSALVEATGLSHWERGRRAIA